MSSSLQDEDDFYLFAAHMCHKRRHQTLHQSGTNWMLIDSQDLNDRLVGYSDHRHVSDSQIVIIQMVI